MFPNIYRTIKGDDSERKSILFVHLCEPRISSTVKFIEVLCLQDKETTKYSTP